MFDVAPTELMLVALVALVVIGPKDLPKLMRTVGYWVGRARGGARPIRAGEDASGRDRGDGKALGGGERADHARASCRRPARRRRGAAADDSAAAPGRAVAGGRSRRP